MNSTRGDSQRVSGEYGMIPIPSTGSQHGGGGDDNVVVGADYGVIANETEYKSIPHSAASPYDRVEEEPRSQYSIISPVQT